MAATDLYLASFFGSCVKLGRQRIKRYSVARWQPNLFFLETLPYLAPTPAVAYKGLDLVGYRKLYDTTMKMNGSYQKAVDLLLAEDTPKGIAFLCWCNPERQKEYPGLKCHTILIGYEMERRLPNLKVHYLDGRDRPVWERIQP